MWSFPAAKFPALKTRTSAAVSEHQAPLLLPHFHTYNPLPLEASRFSSFAPNGRTTCVLLCQLTTTKGDQAGGDDARRSQPLGRRNVFSKFSRSFPEVFPKFSRRFPEDSRRFPEDSRRNHIAPPRCLEASRACIERMHYGCSGSFW
jgi:hypothetical protein